MIYNKVKNGEDNMEEIIKVVLDNGLGFGSFVSLLWFIFKYEDKQSNTMEQISSTLVEVKTSLSLFNERLNKIEERLNEKGGD